MLRQMTQPVAARTSVVILALAGSLNIVPDVAAQDGAPPPGSPPVLRDVRLAFPTQGDTPMRPVDDYWQMIGLPRPSALHPGPTWTLFARVEAMILDGAQRLWLSGQFHSVWVDVEDAPFKNGALAKRVIFNVVERVQPSASPRGLPEPPPGYEHPPPSHERLYPPPEGAR